MQNWKPNALTSNIRKQIAEQNASVTPQVFVYRQKAAVFGYNAPKKPTYKGSPPVPDDPANWAEWNLESEISNAIYSWTVPMKASLPAVSSRWKEEETKTIQVLTVTTLPRTAYGISSKTT